MRITAGQFKGHALAAPGDFKIRPTSDKVRQALFNILAHHDFGSSARIEGARVLDLFAGTGALGLEALSRGARYGLFVEEAAAARALIRRNVEALALTGVTKIWRRDATQMGPCPGEAYTLAFLDPPYRKNLIPPALASLRDGNWLVPGALFVIETAKNEDIPSTDGFALRDFRTYGDSRVSFFVFEKA